MLRSGIISILFLLFYLAVAAVSGLRCFVCDTFKTDVGCSRFSSSSEPDSCDYVHNARFCVKMEGIVEGQLGTKRFCSSVNPGNVCEYLQRPEDNKTYQSCIYTCSTDGCNSSTNVRPVALVVLLSLVFLLCQRHM